MKKIIVLVVAACLALAVTLPAMAVDVDFSGYYRVRGFVNSNVTLIDDDNAETEAYYDNRFRLQTVFTANDRVSLTTRFDVFNDLLWGDQVNSENADPITWERVHMNIRTDIGMFTIGHQQAGMWGLAFFDEDYNDDRIKFVTKLDDVIVGAIIQKTRESDATGDFQATGSSDADLDVYYAFGIYKQENIEAGLLGAYARDGATGMKKIAALPYWNLTFGDIGFKGEIIYETGDQSANQDLDALSYGIEGSYSLDMARLFAGWVTVSGLDDSGDFTLGNAAYGGLGEDFRPFAILTDNLGGKILNSGAGVLTGVDLWYAGADVTVNDRLSVDAILGQATANEDWMVGDDDYGMEFDIGATYQLMDNLEYRAVLAYLMTGDLLGDDDNLGMMHQLKLSF